MVHSDLNEEKKAV